jgi:hypothetical protein
MMALPQRPVIKAAAEGAPMSKSLALKVSMDDILLIGPFRIEFDHIETRRRVIKVRVEAPDQPVALLSGGRVRVGAHHELTEQEDE